MPTQPSGEEREWWLERLDRELDSWRIDGIQTVIFPNEVYRLFKYSLIPSIVQEASRLGREAGIKEAMEIVEEEIRQTGGYPLPEDFSQLTNTNKIKDVESWNFACDTIISRLESLIQKYD